MSRFNEKQLCKCVIQEESIERKVNNSFHVNNNTHFVYNKTQFCNIELI